MLFQTANQELSPSFLETAFHTTFALTRMVTFVSL